MMKGHQGRKPENIGRAMPTASFSLRAEHLEAIRREALRQGVSQSEIVRQALDMALQTRDPARDGAIAAHPSHGGPSYLALAVRPLAKELAVIRRDLNDLRQTVARLEDSLPPRSTDSSQYVSYLAGCRD